MRDVALLERLGARAAIARLPGCALHYVEAGSGSPIVLLHGMPACWYSWREQVGPLVAAGHRVIVPDLPGYGRSTKLGGVAAYDDARILDHMEAFVREVAGGRAAIAGHDRGGWIAWLLAMHRPALVERLAVVAVPHPARLRWSLRRWAQIRRSYYVYLLQLPWLPEAVLRARGHALLRRAIAANRVVTPIDPDDLEVYVRSAAEPGALTGMLQYYRANARAVLRRDPLWWAPRLPTVSAPTLVVWPTADRYQPPDLADPDPADVPRACVVRVEGGHWLHEDNPAAVNAALVPFLAPSVCGRRGPAVPGRPGPRGMGAGC